MENINDSANTWQLVPTTKREIELARTKCRRLVIRRAFMSAGVSAIPLPLIDIAFDARLLATLIDDINAEFGLTSEQIQQRQPKAKSFSYQAIATIGSMLAGRVATRQLAFQLLKRSGIKYAAKNSARIVHIAGQTVSAAIGFATLRSMGYEHIDTCALIALELAALPAGRDE